MYHDSVNASLTGIVVRNVFYFSSELGRREKGLGWSRAKLPLDSVW